MNANERNASQEIIVTVVIVNYRVKWFLAQTLDAATEALAHTPHEIIVVDNNSGDDSIAYAKSKFPQVKFIENKDNTGFAKANNQAIMQAHGIYTLILNPDTIVTREAITDAIDYLDNHPNCGAVGTRMIDGNGTFLPESKRSFPTPWVSFCKIFGLQSLFPKSRIFGKYALQYLDAGSTHTVEILAGAYIMARTSVLKRINGFDEAFFMYGEDIDLSYRITQAGYYNVYLPTPIIHYKGESTHKDDFRYVKVFYQAMIIFFKKHYPHFSVPFYLFIQAGIGVRASAAILRRVFSKVFPTTHTHTGAHTPVTILDRGEMSYSQIVNTIMQSHDDNVSFGIKSPVCGNIVITPKMSQK